MKLIVETSEKYLIHMTLMGVVHDINYECIDLIDKLTEIKKLKNEGWKNVQLNLSITNVGKEFNNVKIESNKLFQYVKDNEITEEDDKELIDDIKILKTNITIIVDMFSRIK